MEKSVSLSIQTHTKEDAQQKGAHLEERAEQDSAAMWRVAVAT